ncbi:MAG: PAS domain S-box protein, partial [Candidatus Latescibacteria bacterium]|nr:PAS domain S-box protein [bacterium]MBD3425191.1 PAS domain S-box protein [Candidatus Latescibacterota bacterium]
MKKNASFLSRIIDSEGKNTLDTRRRRLLNVILLVVAASSLLALAALLILHTQGLAGEEREVRLLGGAIASALAGSILVYWLNRRISGEAAAGIFILLLIGLAGFSDLPSEVVGGRGLFAFAIPIVAASVILRPWASFMAAAVSSAVIILIGTLAAGIPVPNIPVLLGFFVLALVSYLSARSMEEAMDELAESEKQYRLLFENTVAGVGMAYLSGEVIRMNSAISAITGYTEEDIPQMNVADTYVDPEDRKRLLRKLKEDGRVENFVVQLKRKDGEKYWAELFVKPVIYRKEKVLLTSQLDINERVKMEKALLESERKMATLIGNLQGMAYR